MPFVNNLQPHLLMYSFHKPYKQAVYDYIISQSFVHKCTYKFDKELLNTLIKNNLQNFMEA